MKDAFAHCEALVREADKDRFLSALFAPAAHRGGLFALYAFNVELARIPAAVTQPLAGEIRLQWWIEAMEGKRDDEAAANPVAAAMIETVQRYRLPLGPLLDIADASRAALYATDESEARVLAATALIELAARILNDGADAGIGDLAHHAGIAWAAFDDARALRHLAEAGTLVSGVTAAALPALLPLALIRPLREGKPLPPWRRQWLLWRAARNPARIFR